jgi:UDP-N-acetyl-D-glucosamine 2-epimerase, UDP-hydrolysing
MAAIDAHPTLTLQVVVTGMHLSPTHGRTVEAIRADGFDIDRTVLMQLEGDSGAAMAASVGTGMVGMTMALGEPRARAVVVLGDRGEPFAAAVVAAHLRIPVAHLHGGDVTGGAIIDDSLRHAITRFAHLHFPATPTSAQRIEAMGEEPWRIDTIGAPGIDDIRDGRMADADAVAAALGVEPSAPLVVVLQHPLTVTAADAAAQMRMTLEAAAATDAQLVVIYPNADAGGKRMIAAIEAFEHPAMVTAESLDRRLYLGLLSVADVLVGNSSGGIIEAPSLGLPVVNIGPRQAGRERADAVVSVEHDRAAIEAAIECALSDPAVRAAAEAASNPYDRGHAGERVAARLAAVPLDEALLRKQLTH